MLFPFVLRSERIWLSSSLLPSLSVFILLFNTFIVPPSKKLYFYFQGPFSWLLLSGNYPCFMNVVVSLISVYFIYIYLESLLCFHYVLGFFRCTSFHLLSLLFSSVILACIHCWHLSKCLKGRWCCFYLLSSTHIVGRVRWGQNIRSMAGWLLPGPWGVTNCWGTSLSHPNS